MSKFTAAHIRRAALVAAPVLGGLFCVVGSIADPDPTKTGLALVETYTNHWDDVQWKSMSYHYGYMFIGATALGMAALVRKGKGVKTALVAVALAILGISTLPGMLISDFYASAGGQIVGPEKMYEIEQASQDGWGGLALWVPGMLGFVLSLPLSAIALMRSGLVRWHVPALMVAAIASFIGGATNNFGPILMTVFFALLGACIARIPVAAFGGREGRDLPGDASAGDAADDANLRDDTLVAV